MQFRTIKSYSFGCSQCSIKIILVIENEKARFVLSKNLNNDDLIVAKVDVVCKIRSKDESTEL